MRSRIRQFLWLLVLIYPAFSSISLAQETALTGGLLLNSDQASAGYILFTPTASPITYLIDNDGRIVHQWQGSGRSMSIYLLENGHLVMNVIQPSQRFVGGTTGLIEEYDWDGNLVWSFEYQSDLYSLHHDYTVLPNGNLIVAAWEVLPEEEALALGLLPEMLPIPRGNLGENQIQDQALWLDMLLEVDRETSEIIWEWHTKDHLIQDQNPDLPNYGILAEHPGLIDLNHANQRQPNDRTHFNSVSYNAELGQVLVSSLSFSEIWVINHRLSSQEAAGEAGNLLYRWGNPQVYGRGTDDDRQLFNQHDAHWQPDGSIQIFNNGHQRFRPYSTVIEIVPPLLDDGKYALDADLAYKPQSFDVLYQGTPPEAFFSQNTSGAQRLPNGNLFITEGPAGRMFEVNATGEIVWDYLNPIFVSPHPDSRGPIFRARRYLPDDPAFTGRDLTPGDWIPVQVVRGAAG